MLELAAGKAAATSAWDEPGTIAFLVILGMSVIMYFVFRSLVRHLRKINEAARQEAAQAGQTPDGSVPGDPADRGPQNPWSRSEYEQQQSEQNAALMDFER